MRGAVLLGLLLLSLAAAQCNVAMTSVLVGQHPSCADGVPPEQAEVYPKEAFYVCATFSAPNGQLNAFEERVVPSQDVSFNGGTAIINGLANTIMHKTYYVTLNMTLPCDAVFTVPIEVKDKCTQLPPSTIQVLPNAIREGEEFTVEVANSPKDLDMNITGLASEVSARVPQGGQWTRAFPSSECPNGCTLRFYFTDPRHFACANDATTIELHIAPAQAAANGNGETLNPIMLVILAVVVIGVASTIILTSR